MSRRAYPDVSCEKAALCYLYIVCGSLAAGFAALGAFMTICALNAATVSSFSTYLMK